MAGVFDRLGGDVLGVVREEYGEGTGASGEALDRILEMVIELRAGARKEKNFALADKIRDDLASYGIGLEDGATGTRWRWE